MFLFPSDFLHRPSFIAVPFFPSLNYGIYAQYRQFDSGLVIQKLSLFPLPFFLLAPFHRNRYKEDFIVYLIYLFNRIYFYCKELNIPPIVNER